MTYHIPLFQNTSGKNAVTANPVQGRDTYFIPSDKSQNPGHNVRINKGEEWTSYDEAFLHANFIYTGTFTYCFWDNKKSAVLGITAQAPNKVELLYDGSAGDLVLTIKSDGTIHFTRAT